jgi:hypothetical protein
VLTNKLTGALAGLRSSSKPCSLSHILFLTDQVYTLEHSAQRLASGLELPCIVRLFPNSSSRSSAQVIRSSSSGPKVWEVVHETCRRATLGRV